jgi:hypothetical protein
MACLTEGIYLIHIREFIITNKNIFKLGRSHNIDTRMGRYPKGSSIIAQLECCNSVQCEKDLLVLFKSKFVQQKYYGIEYFEGDKYDMMDIICNEVKKYNNIEKEKVDAVKKIKEIEANNEIDRKKKEEEKVKDITIKKVKHEEQDKAEDKAEDKEVKEDKEKIIYVNRKDNIINKNLDRTCTKCKTIFKYPSFLQTHMKESVRCKFSEKELINFNKTVDELKIITNNNNFTCNHCKSSFTRNATLVYHNKNSKCGKSQQIIENNVKKIIITKTELDNITLEDAKKLIRNHNLIY